MTYVSPKKVQVQLISLPGFLQGRREAAPPGDSLQTQNPTLHERPGAVPATPGLHRRLERAERIGARTSSAITTPKKKSQRRSDAFEKKTTSSISGLLSEQLKKKVYVEGNKQKGRKHKHLRAPAPRSSTACTTGAAATTLPQPCSENTEPT